MKALANKSASGRYMQHGQSALVLTDSEQLSVVLDWIMSKAWPWH